MIVLELPVIYYKDREQEKVAETVGEEYAETEIVKTLFTIPETTIIRIAPNFSNKKDGCFITIGNMGTYEIGISYSKLKSIWLEALKNKQISRLN